MHDPGVWIHHHKQDVLWIVRRFVHFVDFADVVEERLDEDIVGVGVFADCYQRFIKVFGEL